jgi:hypothetical protein
VISDELDAQPPSAAPSATIPIILILLIPRPDCIQAQPGVDGKGEHAKAHRKGIVLHRVHETAVAIYAFLENDRNRDPEEH